MNRSSLWTFELAIFSANVFFLGEVLFLGEWLADALAYTGQLPFVLSMKHKQVAEQLW
jgi:hypothetical protein